MLHGKESRAGNSTGKHAPPMPTAFAAEHCFRPLADTPWRLQTTVSGSKTATPMPICLSNKSRIGAQPDTVLATSAPDVQGNWIASRIVKRFSLEYHQDKAHRIVPLQLAASVDKMNTRLYVDLSCGAMNKTGQASPCRHRFFILNGFKYDLLLGGTESSNRKASDAEDCHIHRPHGGSPWHPPPRFGQE